MYVVPIETAGLFYTNVVMLFRNGNFLDFLNDVMCGLLIIPCFHRLQKHTGRQVLGMFVGGVMSVYLNECVQLIQ